MSFDQVLDATARMLRMMWKSPLCIFLQTDDQGRLGLRAADGMAKPEAESFARKTSGNPFKQCLSGNEIVECDPQGLGSSDQKLILVPVSGQSRTLGILVLGPFPRDLDMRPKEAELRSAGALCAVLSAHLRLYDWMSKFMPELNHELRTPLTAVQGSIGMVLGGVFGQVGGEVKEMLEMAHKGCERTVQAIEAYLNKQEP